MSDLCPNCGSPAQAGHRFCSVCGYKFLSAGGESSSQQLTSASNSTEATQPSTPSTPSAPVTYVVQRYGTDPQPEAGASSAPPSSLRTDDPFVPFVPPSNSGVSQETAAISAASAPTVPVALPVVQQSSGSTSSPEPYVPPMPMSTSVPSPRAAYGATPPTTGSATFGNFTPPPSARKDGAYAPYVTDAAKPVEQTAPARSLLMPALLAGAAVLLVLVLAVGYFLFKPSSNTVTSVSPVSTTTTVTSQLPANASEEDKVKDTVRRSNDEQIKAWHDLDSEVLKGTRIGKVLDENVQMVDMLKSRNMYAQPVNERLDFVDVKVNGDNATVRTIETWTVTFYNKADNKAIQKNGPDTLHETYTMVKVNGNWMVSDLSIDGDPNATPTAVSN